MIRILRGDLIRRPYDPEVSLLGTKSGFLVISLGSTCNNWCSGLVSNFKARWLCLIVSCLRPSLVLFLRNDSGICFRCLFEMQDERNLSIYCVSWLGHRKEQRGMSWWTDMASMLCFHGTADENWLVWLNLAHLLHLMNMGTCRGI